MWFSSNKVSYSYRHIHIIMKRLVGERYGLGNFHIRTMHLDIIKVLFIHQLTYIKILILM